MARFETKGLDDLIAALEKDKAIADKAAPEMLAAGGAIIVKGWKDAITKHDLIDTGDMIKSVAPTITVTDHVKKAEIYPQGKDRKGVRNAEKAFVNHYGTSTRKATHFVDDAEAQSEGPAIDAMAAIFYGKLESEG